MSETPAKGPVDAVAAITYRCNLKCVTCDLAERESPATLAADVLARLPTSLKWLNLTGGEPFLCDELPALVRAAAAAAPRAVITISTNGSLPARAAAVVRDLSELRRRLHVTVSVDGGRETHDRIRQAPGSYDRAVETLERLKPILGTGVHVAFTLSAANVGELEAVAALAGRYGLPFTLAVTHSSEHYFRPRADAVPRGAAANAALDAAVKFYLAKFSAAAAARAYFAAGLKCVLAGRPRPIPCRAGDRFFYLDPAANVYLCNMRAEVLGNMAAAPFNEIWAGAARRGLLPTVGRACPVQCWMVCTARTAVRDHAARVADWAARAYGSRLAGRPAPDNCG